MDLYIVLREVYWPGEEGSQYLSSEVDEAFRTKVEAEAYVEASKLREVLSIHHFIMR